jgi:hypothetical protein
MRAVMVGNVDDIDYLVPGSETAELNSLLDSPPISNLSISFDDYHIRYGSAPWPLSDVLVCGTSGAESIPIVAFHGDDGFAKGSSHPAQ